MYGFYKDPEDDDREDKKNAWIESQSWGEILDEETIHFLLVDLADATDKTDFLAVRDKLNEHLDAAYVNYLTKHQHDNDY